MEDSKVARLHQASRVVRMHLKGCKGDTAGRWACLQCLQPEHCSSCCQSLHPRPPGCH